MLFKDFMVTNKTALKDVMVWDNFGLNDVVLTATDPLKEKALLLLTQNYGKFEVEDILDEMLSDVYTNFPILMQSLSIATSMTYQSVARNDHETETRTIAETSTNTNNSTATNNSVRDTTNDSIITENNTLIGEIKNTGTVGSLETSERTETNSLDGSTVVTTPSTGGKTVSLSHAMPEQAIDGTTGNFTKDAQGTPNLNISTVQNASENFNTTNQFQNTQEVEQTQSVDNSITNNNTRTDDTTQTTDNATEIHNTNSIIANDVVEETNIIEGVSEIVHSTTDTVERVLANKQYPFEVSHFLESINSVKSFKIWIDSFAWICGVF